jgi:hypothetical protein
MTVSDIFLILAMIALFPTVIHSGLDPLKPYTALLAGASLIVAGGLIGSMFAPNPYVSVVQLAKLSLG